MLDGFIPYGAPAAATAPAAPPPGTGEPDTRTPPGGEPAASGLGEPSGAPGSHPDVVNPWVIPDTKDNAPSSAPAAPAAPQEQPGNNLDAVNAAIDAMELAADFDVNAIAQEMGVAPETLGKLHEGIKGVVRKTFLQTMTATRRMQSQMMEQMKKDVSQDARGTLRFDSAQALLESKLPMLKDPAMAPVARASLKSFLDQGMSMDAAVDKTVAYFKQIHGNLGKHFQGANPNARPGGMPGGFGQPQMETEPGSTAPAEEPDWLSIFGGVNTS